jgi:hypothetical protein
VAGHVNQEILNTALNRVANRTWEKNPSGILEQYIIRHIVQADSITTI